MIQFNRYLCTIDLISRINLKDIQSNSYHHFSIIPLSPSHLTVLHQLVGLCWLNIPKAYLDFTALIYIFHPPQLKAQSLHALHTASCSPNFIQECNVSLMSCYLVASSDHAGLYFKPLQRASGDHSVGYPNYRVQCSVAMFVELSIAPVRQPMQMPGTAHSIPSTYE